MAQLSSALAQLRQLIQANPTLAEHGEKVLSKPANPSCYLLYKSIIAGSLEILFVRGLQWLGCAPASFVVQVVSEAAATQSSVLPTLMSPLGPVINLGFAAFSGNNTSPAGQPHLMVAFFENIPYTQPPVGNLCFRPLKPLDKTIRNPAHVPISNPWDWGASCIQQPAQVGIGSEDHLKLNIWKPSGASETSGLPVIVYFHGGAIFNEGFMISMMLHWSGFRETSIDEVMIAGGSAGAVSMVMKMVAFSRSKVLIFKCAIMQSIGFGPTPTSVQVKDTFSMHGCMD
ncbi:alpha/beta-hydrolase [Pleurotus eryngii]|uniref:Alpha/beta-hydrolase n=1 Tax=Pleurotus eryngii TaxID=5323 RepID=A0A9P6D6F5_PLEER|nr:alpha/beta-hydrolase [Pleurotus eryngii]